MVSPLSRISLRIDVIWNYKKSKKNYFRESKSQWLKLEDGSKVFATAVETVEYVSH